MKQDNRIRVEENNGVFTLYFYDFMLPMTFEQLRKLEFEVSCMIDGTLREQDEKEKK